MLNYFSSYLFSELLEYGFSLLLLNIVIYLLITTIIFSIFFFFDLTIFKTLNQLKELKGLNFFFIVFILSLLSLAGMPPLLGFVGKFFLFIFLALKNQFFLFFLFTVLNIFTIYFYIQNIRFMVTKKNTIALAKLNVNPLLDLRLIYYIVFLNFFNIFGLFYFEDYFILFNFWSSFLYN